MNCINPKMYVYGIICQINVTLLTWSYTNTCSLFFLVNIYQYMLVQSFAHIPIYTTQKTFSLINQPYTDLKYHNIGAHSTI